MAAKIKCCFHRQSQQKMHLANWMLGFSKGLLVSFKGCFLIRFRHSVTLAEFQRGWIRIYAISLKLRHKCTWLPPHQMCRFFLVPSVLFRAIEWTAVEKGSGWEKLLQLFGFCVSSPQTSQDRRNKTVIHFMFSYPVSRFQDQQWEVTFCAS